MEIDKVVANPTEPDHHLVWLTIDEVKEKLFFLHQIWAVEEIYNLFQTLNRLYIFLLKNQGENYEIEDAGHISEF